MNRARVAKAAMASPLKVAGSRKDAKSPRRKSTKAKTPRSTITTATTHNYRLRSNRKVFPFFKLAPELRQKILIYAFVEEDAFTVSLEESFDEIFTYKFISTPSPIHWTKIFLLNKQFFNEALPVAYGLNTFNFESLARLWLFVKDKETLPKYMKKVTLVYDQTLNDAHCYKLFDIWALLQPDHRKFGAEEHSETLSNIFQKIPQTPYLTTKITVFFENDRMKINYFPRIFALIFLDRAFLPEQRFHGKFTVPNPFFTAASDIEPCRTKSLPREVKKSLVSSSLASIYLFHLAARYAWNMGGEETQA